MRFNDHLNTNHGNETITMDQRLHVLEDNLNQMFLVLMGVFIFFMQCGFAFLEAGSVRSKNTTNILFKNLLDMLVGAIAYWAFGYSFSFGKPGNAFIGHNYFFSTFLNHEGYNVSGTSQLYEMHTKEEHDMLDVVMPYNYHAMWFFHFVFAATAATIVSGAMAERTDFACYLTYSFTITGFVYPVVAHWVWADEGWLKGGAGTGLYMQDFAGSGVVHITGGTVALLGAYLVEPRYGRFNKNGTVNPLLGHNVPLVLLGVFILIVGFVCFNGGSQQSITEPGDGSVIAKAVMNTILSGSTGGLSAMVLNRCVHAFAKKQHFWSLLVTLNGTLTGMVSVCAGCNDLHTWSAVFIGFLSGAIYLIWSHVILKARIDDPLDAVAVHLGGGLTGVIMAPIFAINGQRNSDGSFVGGVIFTFSRRSLEGLGWNILGAVSIILWTGLVCGVMFYMLKMVGLLRASHRMEKEGLDASMHGEPAYPEIYKWNKEALERINSETLSQQELLRDEQTHRRVIRMYSMATVQEVDFG